jgi:hypothetical protein
MEREIIELMNFTVKITTTTHPSSSIIWNVLLESFAIATHDRAKMPYGAVLREKKDSGKIFTVIISRPLEINQIE